MRRASAGGSAAAKSVLKLPPSFKFATIAVNGGSLWTTSTRPSPSMSNVRVESTRDPTRMNGCVRELR